MEKIVAKYHGVNVIQSCGFYYPEVNTNIELKSIKEVKEWIENIWLFIDNNMKQLSFLMDVPKKNLMNFITKM
jgi:hypothetical protein